ncbi:MAG: tRNA (adenosine(37)-N6)-dimethylallyltransferase MiaA [Thermoguttaceae bacterium]|nr:tRNA (adenosine(37)-N6)-dimethylallyltransferase MiaA [Thermoguttaceae bacterium]MDW8078621.1 tRNA (adenosine(37)-N6)-dimethylallyltransferase MiaA [Thermoguttaceae bacterium]
MVETFPQEKQPPEEPEQFPPILDAWYLTGPTASGKTAVAVELARRLGAEIISLDSMAVYRGMDIGTAKPSPEERRLIPHHLVDCVDPNEEFSVAQYLQKAHELVQEIRDRGKVPLFAGGTPLYLKALLRGLFIGPAADWDLRRQLMARADREGPAALHRELAQVDPTTAARLHPQDTRRIVRALEVYLKTGRPISKLQQQFNRENPPEKCRVFVLLRTREDLRKRIAQRVAGMLESGLVDEVRKLLKQFGSLSRTARQAVGYREVLAFLEGRCRQEELADLIATHTWQLARRQLIWFRSLRECRFVPVGPFDAPEEIAERILALAAGDGPSLRESSSKPL